MIHLAIHLSSGRTIEWLEDDPKPGAMNIRDANARGPGTVWPLQALHMKTFSDMIAGEIRVVDGVTYMKDEL